VVVETARVRAVFSNRGARLRHWVLKDYRDDQGNSIDLVPEVIPPDMPLPFSLRVEDPAATSRLNDALFQVNGPQDTSVSFTLETTDGMKAQKTFALDPQTYVVTFSANVTQNDRELNPVIQWGPGITDDVARTQPGGFLSPSYVYRAQAIYHNGSSVERHAATAMPSGLIQEGQYRWVGIDDHYFISALLQPPTPVRVEYQPVTIPSPATPPVIGHYVTYAVQLPSTPTNVRFYIGPKQLDVMRSIDPEFTRAIYFGMFAWLAAPLLDALRWVHGYIGNWGWSIIVLTILINLAMFPLRHKSVVSMRKMQEVQPEVKAIQDRYSKLKMTDPARGKMNQELMALYKERGVNPASGCVPMLLTLPVLFAFYAMLSVAIELRGAPFIGQIRDLSAHDPWFVWPIVMGITMFIQQRMTPTTADPVQQKVMLIMPVMMSGMFLWAASGLVIYWTVSNTWAILQQMITNRLIGPAAVRTVRPPAERRVKNVGGGKSDQAKERP